MKKNKHTLILIILSLLIFNSKGYSQILSSSNLPIIMIDTEDEEIPDEPKIPATMGIIFNGDGMINNVIDDFNEYNGNIVIETRGNSTQGFEKKTYSLETKDLDWQDFPTGLFGMGSDEDWILHAMVIDKSQLRIPMSFYLSQQMGHYASNWRYVELIINGEYQGLYALVEKIKRDDDRVNIAKMEVTDISGDAVTGGYILRIDWLDEAEGFESNFDALAGEPMTYQFYYPKAENIQDEQIDYISQFMDDFESAVFDDDYTNDSGIRYNQYINVNSFTDFLLINELSKNSDGYKLSSYLHKERDSDGGKLRAGPIWDFDQTYGVSEVCSNDDYTGWTYLQNQPDCEDFESMPLWWGAMMEDTVFTNHLACRWWSFRESFLHEDSILLWIDEHLDLIDEAIDRNFTLWDYFIGEQIWIEPFPIPETYEEEIIYLKNWISNRLTWMDTNMPGNCENDVILTTKGFSKVDFFVFPNPVDTKLNINARAGDVIQILDVNGQVFFSAQMKYSKISCNLDHFPAGIYFVKRWNGQNYSIKKVVVL